MEWAAVGFSSGKGLLRTWASLLQNLYIRGCEHARARVQVQNTEIQRPDLSVRRKRTNSGPAIHDVTCSLVQKVRCISVLHNDLRRGWDIGETRANHRRRVFRRLVVGTQVDHRAA